jgi:uroporphyrinogen decarboxylase
MMGEMTKAERVRAALDGKTVDRIPVSFFNHNHEVESNTNVLAEYLLMLYRKFDWDFLKASLRPSYYAEAWGCEVSFYPDRVPVIDSYVIHKAEDLRALRELKVTEGVLGEHVEVAKKLRQGLGEKELFIMTLFSPLAVVARLAGGVINTPSEYLNVQRFMNEDPDALHHALRVISETLADYVVQLVRAGANGIYLSTSVWSGDTISQDDYKKFGKPYDLTVLNSAVDEGADFNILHICRENIFFDAFIDYPVDVINYEATSQRNPSLKEAMCKTDKALWGGLDHRNTLVNGPEDKIIAETYDALDQTGGTRFILGNGCTSPSDIPDAHYIAAREATISWRGQAAAGKETSGT